MLPVEREKCQTLKRSISTMSVALTSNVAERPVRIAKSVTRCVLFAATVTVAGCTGFRATKDDQLRSLEEFDQAKFSAPLRLPEANNVVADISNARFFLRRISFWVYDMADADTLTRFEQASAALCEGKDDVAETWGKELSVRQGITVGSGVAITEDGYIATAAHVVQQRNVFVMDAVFSSGRAAELHGTRARVVFADREADFALLKCEWRIPQCLTVRPEEPPVGTIMFSGGWQNESGAGRLIECQEFCSDTGHRYRKLRSTVPILPGDSGAAVIDSAGRLLGVTAKMVYGRLWRLTAKSDAVMLDPAELQQLIAQDRARPR